MKRMKKYCRQSPRKRAIFVAFGVFGLVFLLVSSLLSQAPPRGIELYKKLGAPDLVRFEGQRRVQWMPDGKAYIIQEKDGFKKVDAKTGETTPLFDEAKIIAAYNRLTGKNSTALPFKNFTFIENGRRIMFTEEEGRLVYLCDPATGDMVRHTFRYFATGVRGRRYTEVFSPDYKFTAYARDYNLYLRDLEKDLETALTTDGREELRNGWPDWVYPEELNQYEAFWWSPDGQMIAFMQFDERPVAFYPIVHDAGIPTKFDLMRYPKAGANNPIIRLFVVDVKTKKLTQLDTGVETNVYLFKGQWTPDGREFTFLRMNRWQNQLELLAADPKTGKSRVILKETEPCYFNENVRAQFLSDGQRFLWTSEVTGWKEIYLYDMKGKLLKQLTNLKLPVGNIVEVDEAGGWVYFTGFERRGCDQHLYRVKLDGTGLAKLTSRPGWHSVSVSPGGAYFVDEFSSWDDPPEVNLHAADGTFIRQLGHTVLTEEFLKLNLLKPEPFVFKSADGKDDIDGIIFKPADFDPNKKYPVYYAVYGGPGARMIRNTWQMNSPNQRLAQLGFIVLQTDHSGVSQRGKAFQTKSYLKLGQVELADHVAAIKHLSQYPWFDATRVGITGHSYGGYLTCMALLKEPDVFHVGVAGAPVTDWRNYDSIYTERYMQRPEDNPEGYEKGSCLTYVKNFKGKLQIHHGTVDDNVHPANTIQLIYALLREGKRLEWKMYPEQDHGIRFAQYGQDRLDFMILHLKPETWEQWFKEQQK